jgi:hypothetical protein
MCDELVIAHVLDVLVIVCSEWNTILQLASTALQVGGPRHNSFVREAILRTGEIKRNAVAVFECNAIHAFKVAILVFVRVREVFAAVLEIRFVVIFPLDKPGLVFVSNQPSNMGGKIVCNLLDILVSVIDQT